MKTRFGVIVAMVGLLPLLAGAAEYATESYKTVADRELRMHIVSPDGHSASGRAGWASTPAKSSPWGTPRADIWRHPRPRLDALTKRMPTRKPVRDPMPWR